MTINGLGVYLGRGGLTSSRAREYARAGIRRVLLCAEAVSGDFFAPVALSTKWGEVSKAAGLEVAAYTFPGLARTKSPEAVIEQLFRVLRAANGKIPVLDVEAPYDGPNGPARFRALADAAWRVATPEERSRLVITTLGSPSRPGRVPWGAIVSWAREHPGVSIGLQVYETAASDLRVDARISEVRAAIGSDLVFPCVATYERDGDPNREGRDGPKRLLADLDRSCFVNGRPVTACDLWSGASLDAAELAVLPSYVQNMGWPCAR